MFIGLVNLKWDGDISKIQEHIATLSSADAKLTAMKKPINSEFLAFMLLHSLPDSDTWETFKSSILNSMPKGEIITFQDIANCLMFTATHLQGTATESALKAKPTWQTPNLANTLIAPQNTVTCT